MSGSPRWVSGTRTRWWWLRQPPLIPYVTGAPGAVGDVPVGVAPAAASALWVPPEPLALTATAVPAVAATSRGDDDSAL
jgi:hypothetical protein